jgi:hypothetical protein
MLHGIRSLILTRKNGRLVCVQFKLLLVRKLLLRTVKPVIVVQLWFAPTHLFAARNLQLPSSGSF